MKDGPKKRPFRPFLWFSARFSELVNSKMKMARREEQWEIGGMVMDALWVPWIKSKRTHRAELAFSRPFPAEQLSGSLAP